MIRSGRIVVAAMLSAAAIAYTAQQIFRVAAVERAPETPQQILASEPIQLGDFLSRARARMRNLFPPDRAGAQVDLQRALPMAPLKSETWFLLAENQLLAGVEEDGLQALRYSDEADPKYPGQLLRSAQLWALAGETDRAAENARAAALMNPARRKDSVNRLQALGFEEIEILELLGADSLTRQEIAELLPMLRTQLPDVNARLIDRAGIEAISGSPALWGAAYGLASDPVQFSELVKLWRLRAELIGQMPPLFNPELQTPPFLNLPLGWIRPRSAEASWISPADRGTERGALEIRSKTKALGEVIYRAVIPAGRAFEGELSVRAATGRPLFWLEAHGGETARLRGASQELSADWERFSVTIPAQDADRILSVFIAARFSEEPTAFELTALRLLEIDG